MLSFHIISICYYTGIIFMKWTQGKEDSRVALSGFRGVKDINHIFILFIYNMAFCPSSFSLQFYGINFLCPASGNFLYLVSKGRSTGCARNENSVSFHHAMFAHQCRNSEKYGINFFPYSSYWVRQQDALKCILKVRMYFNLRHVSASAMLTKVELPKRQWNFTKDCRRDKETYLRRVGGFTDSKTIGA